MSHSDIWVKEPQKEEVKIVKVLKQGHVWHV